MAVVIERDDGGVSVMRLLPSGVRRKSDGKIFLLGDRIEQRGEMYAAHVQAVDPTPLEDLPGDVAAAATNIVKVGEVSAREAFGIKRMFEPSVPIFDVIYTPVHEGFKAQFDVAMMDEAPNEEWEFIWPNADTEVEKWKQSSGGNYVSHSVIPFEDLPLRGKVSAQC